MNKKYVSAQAIVDEVYYANRDGENVDHETLEALIAHMDKPDIIELDALNDTPFLITAIDKVVAERRHQIEKWGADTDNTPFEWMSILGEEFGELCEATNETFFKNSTHPELGGLDRVVKEASQVAAVAIAIIESATRASADKRAEQ